MTSARYCRGDNGPSAWFTAFTVCPADTPLHTTTSNCCGLKHGRNRFICMNFTRREAVLRAKFALRAQRVQGQIGTDDMAASDSEKVRQLAGAATYFEHRAVVRDAVVQ